MSIIIKKVKIRSWNEMLKMKNAKLTEFGNIIFKGSSTFFNRQMRHLCGKTIEVVEAKRRIGNCFKTKDSYQWNITKNMVIPSHRKRIKQ